MNDAMYDVIQEQFTRVIREMIRHENDVTNHSIVWLLKRTMLSIEVS